MAMSRDGNVLITGSADGICKWWKVSQVVSGSCSNNNGNNSNSGSKPVEWAVFRDHILGITDIEWIESERGFTASSDCTVKLYCALSRQPVSSLSFPDPLSALRVD